MNRRWQRGFTLLELMIGLFLLGLIMSLLFAGMRLASGSWDAVEVTGARTDEIRRVGTLLRREFESIYPYRWKKTLDRTIGFSGGRDSVRYVSDVSPRARQGGLVLVEVAAERADTGIRLVMRRKLPQLGQRHFDGWDKNDAVVLLEGLDEVSFEYFGADTPTGRPNWRQKWEDPQRLPRLLRLTIKPKDAPAWPAMVVASRISEIAGCDQWNAVGERCEQQ